MSTNKKKDAFDDEIELDQIREDIRKLIAAVIESSTDPFEKTRWAPILKDLNCNTGNELDILLRVLGPSWSDYASTHFFTKSANDIRIGDLLLVNRPAYVLRTKPNLGFVELLIKYIDTNQEVLYLVKSNQDLYALIPL